MGRDNELFKLSGNDIREYFKFSVRMSAKPSTGSYTILIDDTQRPKLLVLVFIVPDARKGLKAIIFLEKKKDERTMQKKRYGRSSTIHDQHFHDLHFYEARI